MGFALVARRLNATNDRLARAGRVAWDILAPAQALERLTAGDVALGRLDVLPTLDGVDDGLAALGELEARGVTVLNPAGALLAAHDKLVTARLLHGAGLPHPATRFVSARLGRQTVEGRVVVKPRFGSWGREVVLCLDSEALERHLDSLRGAGWFDAQGALVQELVEPLGFDLRLIVAGGRVVGAARRIAAPGEWRTNVALGGHREPVVPPADARALALAAAAAAGTSLVGVDLLPTPSGDWTIIELNGAVDFTADYSLGRDVFAAVSDGLVEAATGRALPPAAEVVEAG